MASILKVDKIRGTGLDSDTISLDGTGNITIPKNVTFSGSLTSSQALVQTNRIVFHANRISSNQTISAATETTIQFNNTTINVGSCYSTGTYKFTPTTAGNYYLYSKAQLTGSFGDNSTFFIAIRKNGSGISLVEDKVWESGSYSISKTVNIIVAANGSSDYFDVSIYNGSGNPPVRYGASFTQFGGYLL